MKTHDDNGDQADEEDAEEYELEEIWGHIHTEYGFWFLLKYKDYAEPSWEHESLVSAHRRRRITATTTTSALSTTSNSTSAHKLRKTWGEWFVCNSDGRQEWGCIVVSKSASV